VIEHPFLSLKAIPVIVWGVLSLLVAIGFTMMGKWILAIFFMILSVGMINAQLKSAKRRKPSSLPS
jgi:hypothetical protein